VHPDDHPRLGRLLDQLEHRAVVPGGEHAPVTEALRLCHVDGTVVPFALTFTDLFDDPTVEGIVVTGHDISDRVQMVEELRAANSVVAAALESTADGILVIDEDMRIANFNGRFAEMWRVPEGTVRPGADASCLAWCAEQLRDP